MLIELRGKSGKFAVERIFLSSVVISSVAASVDILAVIARIAFDNAFSSRSSEFRRAGRLFHRQRDPATLDVYADYLDAHLLTHGKYIGRF